jgi:hypothetical protein
MSEQFLVPESVVMALWLNSARLGAVSVTDAANALETISGEVTVHIYESSKDYEIKAWLDVVNLVIQQPQPAAVAIPVDGDPAGIPVGVLVSIERSVGTVAISPNALLIKNLNHTWEVVKATHTVIHYDLNQTRRTLIEQIEAASRQLSASDLVGDESEIRATLDAFRLMHIPAHLSKRSTDAIELAARIKIVAIGAMAHAQALHSPSVDRLRITNLEKLVSASRQVLQSVITN